jgi:hypothetical protein
MFWVEPNKTRLPGTGCEPKEKSGPVDTARGRFRDSPEILLDSKGVTAFDGQQKTDIGKFTAWPG